MQYESNARPADSSPAPSTGAPPKKRRWKGVILWALAIAAILFVQWPMLKGLFYRATGIEAPKSTIAWRSDFETALAEAKQSGKPLLVDFSASWCPPCIVMKHDVWPDPEVSRAVTDNYVPLLIDVDDPRNAEVARRYGVSTIPHVVVVGSDGPGLRQAAFMSSSQAMTFLSRDGA